MYKHAKMSLFVAMVTDCIHILLSPGRRRSGSGDILPQVWISVHMPVSDGAALLSGFLAVTGRKLQHVQVQVAFNL